MDPPQEGKEVYTAEPEIRNVVLVNGTAHTYGSSPEIPFEKFRSEYFLWLNAGAYTYFPHEQVICVSAAYALKL